MHISSSETVNSSTLPLTSAITYLGIHCNNLKKWRVPCDVRRGFFLPGPVNQKTASESCQLIVCYITTTPLPRRSMHVWNMHLYSCSWGKSNYWKVMCKQTKRQSTDRQTYRQTKSTGDHKRSLECNWAVKFKRFAYKSKTCLYMYEPFTNKTDKTMSSNTHPLQTKPHIIQREIWIDI